MAEKERIKELQKAPAVLLAFYQEYKTMPEEYHKHIGKTLMYR